MSKGRKREKAPGSKKGESIYLDQHGIAAVAKVKGLRREKRFPRDIDLDIVRSWQDETRAALRDDADALKKQQADPSLLRSCVERFLDVQRKRKRAGFGHQESHLRAWLKVPGLADKSRQQITAKDVERAYQFWRDQGRAIRSLWARRSALKMLYQFLDGKRAVSPTRDVKMDKIPRTLPIPVAEAVIQRVAASMRKGLNKKPGSRRPLKSEARFLVMVYTGQRPIHIARARPDDLDLVRGWWFVRTAKGGNPAAVPLDDKAVAAWQRFIKVKAWGYFHARDLSKMLHRHGWPKGDIHPYRLRHTFAIDYLNNGGDLAQLQGLFGHVKLETTRIYAPFQAAPARAVLARRTLNVLPTEEVATDRPSAARDTP